MKLLLLLALACIPAHATIAWVQTLNTPNGSSVSSLTKNITVSAGSAIIVVMSGSQASAFTFAAPTDGTNTYTIKVSNYDSTKGVAVACAIAANSGTLTISESLASGGPTFMQLIPYEFTGQTCTPDGTDSKTFAGATTATSPYNTYATSGIATTNANNLIIAAIATGSSSTVTSWSAGGTPGTYIIPTNGSIVDGSLYTATASEYQIVSSTGTMAAQFASGVATIPGLVAVEVALQGATSAPIVATGVMMSGIKIQ